MLKKRLVEGVKRATVSLSLSAGILAIASVDTLWHEHLHRNDFTPMREPAAVASSESQPMRTRLVSSSTSKNLKKVTADSTPEQRLREVMADDELDNHNPFFANSAAKPAISEPLKALLKKGVVDFRRQAYRSPQYREESGYDLVEYEIEHTDHSTSRILAYLEAPLLIDGQGVSEPRETIVLVLLADQDLSKQNLLRNGTSIGQGETTLTQVEALVGQRLSSGVPFFSVAR